jgi:hypothetical protein
MNNTQHREFAINNLGVSAKIYDAMNAENEAKNAIILKERAEYEKKLYDFGAGLSDHPGELIFSFEK